MACWIRTFDQLLLPSVMLRQGDPVFLDDMTLDQVKERLSVPIRIVHGAAEIVASALGSLEKTT
jgi:NifB/MoaA-like Fe-S oxidoreductase